MTDYHTHTPLCRHASGTPQEFVAAALRAGLTEYGISDHAPMPNEPFDDWRMDCSQLTDYFHWMKAASHAAPPEKLIVRHGLECDWMEGIQPWIESLSCAHDWDYLIGSVHYLGEKWDFDNPLWIPQWEKINVEEVWTDYWKAYAAMAKSRLFDILGHPDLIKKFGFRPEGDLKRFYEPVIIAIAESGCTLELNTAGWYKPCEEAYPSPEFLQMACEAGIPLVINSDAHAPEEIGRDFDRARDMARAAGYTHTATFAKRKRGRKPL